jgi:hypothetical protein
MVIFSASILPQALPSLKISNTLEFILPVKDPRVFTFPGIFSLPSKDRLLCNDCNIYWLNSHVSKFPFGGLPLRLFLSPVDAVF